MRQLATLVAAAALLLAAAYWLWIALSLPFEDLEACGGGGPIWVGFQAFQKLVAAGGAVAAGVCLFGAVRYTAARGGLQFFFLGGAAMSYTFFAWILMMGVAYTIICS